MYDMAIHAIPYSYVWYWLAQVWLKIPVPKKPHISDTAIHLSFQPQIQSFFSLQSEPTWSNMSAPAAKSKVYLLLHITIKGTEFNVGKL